MTTLIGLSGALRQGSFNSALLRAAAAVVPDGVMLDIRSIRGIPIYDGDVESVSGIPKQVAELKDAVAAADGLLIATPEYNNSIPGVLKNAIDWMTRPTRDIKRVFGGKPVAIMGASPGPWATILGQNAWLPVLRVLGTQPFFGGRLQVANAGVVFTDDGSIADEAVRTRLRQFVQDFAAFVAKSRG
jgi:NAD(P)H-dependent FMN reductase